MVQNINNQQIPGFGSINRIGQTQDGRVVYSVRDPEGNEGGKLSVNSLDVDAFEKSYNKMMNAVPKLQDYTEKAVSPDFQKQKNKQANWARGIGVAIGSAIPIILTRNKKTWVQVLTTVPGAIAGFIAGAFAGRFILTPPGAISFAKATQTLQNLDIKPIIEEEHTSQSQ